MDADRAVSGAAQAIRLLPLDAAGLDPLLGKPGFLHVQTGLGVPQYFDNMTLQLLPGRVIRPAPWTDELRQGTDHASVNRFHEVRDAAVIAAEQESLSKLAGMPLMTCRTEARGEPVQE